MSAPAMPATLKPHLFAELLGIPRRHLSAERLSLLFLAASRQLPEVLAQAFCNRIDVKPRKHLYPFGLVLQAKNGLMFQFTNKFHIPALLRVAGRYVQTMNYLCPDSDWIEPFYEGLAENTRLQYIGENVGLTFLKRYSDIHEWFPTLKVTSYAVLDEVTHANINTLEVTSFMKGRNERLCRVVNVEIIQSIPLCYNPLHSAYRTKLNYCPNTLKRVEFHTSILYGLVPRMINVAFSAVDELIFHKIIGMHISGGEEKDLNRLTTYINIVWAAILNHSGTVIARFRLRFIRSNQTAAEFQSSCRKFLKDFEIECNDSKDRTVDCRLRKVFGASVLECDLKFRPL